MENKIDNSVPDVIKNLEPFYKNETLNISEINIDDSPEVNLLNIITKILTENQSSLYFYKDKANQINQLANNITAQLIKIIVDDHQIIKLTYQNLSDIVEYYRNVMFENDDFTAKINEANKFIEGTFKDFKDDFLEDIFQDIKIKYVQALNNQKSQLTNKFKEGIEKQKKSIDDFKAALTEIQFKNYFYFDNIFKKILEHIEKSDKKIANEVAKISKDYSKNNFDDIVKDFESKIEKYKKDLEEDENQKKDLEDTENDDEKLLKEVQSVKEEKEEEEKEEEKDLFILQSQIKELTNTTRNSFKKASNSKLLTAINKRNLLILQLGKYLSNKISNSSIKINKQNENVVNFSKNYQNFKKRSYQSIYFINDFFNNNFNLRTEKIESIVKKKLRPELISHLVARDKFTVGPTITEEEIYDVQQIPIMKSSGFGQLALWLTALGTLFLVLNTLSDSWRQALGRTLIINHLFFKGAIAAVSAISKSPKFISLIGKISNLKTIISSTAVGKVTGNIYTFSGAKAAIGVTKAGNKMTSGLFKAMGSRTAGIISVAIDAALLFSENPDDWSSDLIGKQKSQTPRKIQQGYARLSNVMTGGERSIKNALFNALRWSVIGMTFFPVPPFSLIPGLIGAATGFIFNLIGRENFLKIFFLLDKFIIEPVFKFLKFIADKFKQKKDITTILSKKLIDITLKKSTNVLVSAQKLLANKKLNIESATDYQMIFYLELLSSRRDIKYKIKSITNIINNPIFKNKKEYINALYRKLHLDFENFVLNPLLEQADRLNRTYFSSFSNSSSKDFKTMFEVLDKSIDSIENAKNNMINFIKEFDQVDLSSHINKLKVQKNNMTELVKLILSLDEKSQKIIREMAYSLIPVSSNEQDSVSEEFAKQVAFS